MPLQKQAITLNFSQGLDTKSDPNQVPLGKFLDLTNSVFTTTGRLTKRNGFANLTSLPNEMQTTITALNDNLIATGSNLYSFNSNSNTWLNKGVIQPVQLDTIPLVRVSTAQSSQSAAFTSSGIACLAYMDGGVAYYQISNGNTGEQIVSRTALSNTATNPRVYLLGQYFVITFTRTVTATPHLSYITIPVANISSPSAVQDISTDVISVTAGYDAIVSNNSLFIGWAATSNAMKLTSLNSTLVLATPITIATHTADLVSITADTSGSTAVIWISFWDAGSSAGYAAAYSQALVEVLAPTQFLTATTITHLTSIATNSVLTLLYEVQNYYSSTGAYPTASVQTDYISKKTVTQAGTVSSATVVLRSVGLASKPFYGPDDLAYVLVAYGPSPTTSNQCTYFLIDTSGNVYMRLAYANGGGYSATQTLPSVMSVDSVYWVPYLVTDFLASVNKGTSSSLPANAIYTQTGINLAKFTLNDSEQYSSEIAGALHLTGGQLWEYDSVKPVEHGFQVWPENPAVLGKNTVGGLVVGKTYYWQFTYEWTDNQGNLHRSSPSIPISYTPASAPVSFTGNRTSGSAVLASVSSFTGLQVGQAITGTGIPANTYITVLNSGASTLTMSANATSGSATATTVTPTSVSSVNLYVPTLRLTYKISPNPVRIVGYRWSTDQQVYYQTTSLTSPTLNDTSVDYVTISDILADSAILGNTLLYTTGGVVENIAAPASTASALFKNRLFLIDAENKNLLWYSKQVLENTPVEMSDLFTIYVAPTSGAQGSTGTVKALSAMDDKLIIFKSDAIYYMTGSGPDNAGNNNDFSEPIFITSSVGCSNPASIVLMPQGLMFQSDKGIWLLGRDLGTRYIGDAVEAYNDRIVKSALSIPGTNQVRFILDNNITLMYDYYFQQWGTFTNLQAISATLYQSTHTYLNQYGQVFQERAGTFVDGSSPVLMSFTTAWANLTGLRGFQRFYDSFLLGTYYTPFKLNVEIAYDYNPNPTQSIQVTPDNYTPKYGGLATWGAPGFWGGPGNSFQARVSPKVQKCQTFQLSVTEVYDSSFGVSPGQGLSLSGMNIVVGVKKGYPTQKASRSFG